jgi:hypothetical protein
LNKATIPIIARLRSLETPVHIVGGSARLIADTSNPSPLTMLLREVNETILGRALRFETSGGTSLTLEAAGRRVLRLSDATGMPGAESCLAVDVLEDEQKDDLIKLMQAFAAPRQELRVTISARGVAGEGVSVGLPVALLADLLLIDLNDPDEPGGTETLPPPEPEAEIVTFNRADAAHAAPRNLARFVQALGPILMASVIRGGEADGTAEGPEEMVGHLQGFLDDEADALQRQLDLVSDRPGGSACLVLGGAPIEGQGVLCARSGDAILLALWEGSPAQSLIRAWAEAEG